MGTPGSDCESTPTGHGVSGICHEVSKHLADLTRIGPDVVPLVAELRRRHREQRHNRIDWDDWFYPQ